MKHSTDFFKDEIRNGFYVPTAIEQAWANTLDVLAEIDRICNKHDITYFADWGTILGAVRHGGFIPWDDDLDICMKRDDYIRFREVADNELPENFCIHDYERHENHWLFLARVVNNKKMCFEPSYLNEHYNFPWLAGIDIFLKDYLYDDAKTESARDREILEILACADGIMEKTISRNTAVSRINELNHKYRTNIPTTGSDRNLAVSLYRLAEQQMGRVSSSASGKIGQIFPWVLKSGLSAGEPKADYERIIRLPFEDTTIPVPACYNRILSRKYGNYCQIRKVWGGHDYPYFESQKKEIEKLSGSAYPAFTFRKDMLIRPGKDESNSLKSISEECLSGLEDYLNSIKEALSEEHYEILEDLFSGSLQLCEDFGTLIEQTKGEDRQHVKEMIQVLEDYCSTLTGFYQKMAQDGVISDFDILQNSLEQVKEKVFKNISCRKEILFLTIGQKEWGSLKPFYDEALKEENTDVYVVILPLMKKDVFGNIINESLDQSESTDLKIMGKSDEAENAIANGVFFEGMNPDHIMEYTDYDPSLHVPDKIYMQFPYDGENPCLTIPRQFYSAELRKYTDELIYIPIGNTSEFTEKDSTDQYTLSCHTSTPGAIYSDRIYVQSENMKKQYVRSLCKFAGEGTKEVWIDKISVSPYSVSYFAGSAATPETYSTAVHKEPVGADIAKDEYKTGKTKRMIYCIGLNEMSEHPGTFISAVRSRFRIFEDTQNNIRVSVALYPSERSEWEKIDPAATDELFSMIQTLVRENKITLIRSHTSISDDIALDFDAYYGSPSPFVPAFISQHTPVMISDYTV